MRLTDKEILANQIYGEDASKILNFLEVVAPNKCEFRTEETFLNFIARKLKPMLRHKARHSKQKQSVDFWNCRAMSMDIRNQVNKAKNVLWCIQLLDGKCGAPKD